MKIIVKTGVVMVLLLMLLVWRDSVEKDDGYLLHEVPFTCQAPMAEWDDYRQQDGCEEACGAMVVSWINHELLLSKEEAKKRILALCEYEEKELGFCEDTGIDDTLEMLQDFWGIDCVISVWPTIGNLKSLLSNGHIILVPINGTLEGLRSERIEGDEIVPNYKLHESDRHMVLLIGYNDEDGIFIVHDPGTRNGACYNFDQQEFVGSICEYQSGSRFDRKPIDKNNYKSRVIVVSRE